MPFKNLLNRRRTLLNPYLPVVCNWHEYNESTGYWCNAEALNSTQNYLTKHLIDYSKTPVPICPGYFRYAYYGDRTSTRTYYKGLYGINYGTYDSAYNGFYPTDFEDSLNEFETSFKCCELNAGSINPSDGTFTVPASVGKNWRTGTWICWMPKEIIFPNPDGMIPTNFPKFSQIDVRLEGNQFFQNAFFATYDLFLPASHSFNINYTATMYPHRVCLYKISDTVFKPFLYTNTKLLMTAAHNVGNWWGKEFKNTDWTSFSKNPETKFFRQIVDAGSNYTINVYEPRISIPTGTKVFLFNKEPLYAKMQNYDPANGANVNSPYFDSLIPTDKPIDLSFYTVYGYYAYSWLNNQYISKTDGKIFTKTSPCFIEQPLYPATGVSSIADSYNSYEFILYTKSGSALRHQVYQSMASDLPTGTAVIPYAVFKWKHCSLLYQGFYADHIAKEHITLAGIQKIGDETLKVDGKILVINQNNPIENGLYVVKSGPWIRDNSFGNFAESVYRSTDFTFNFSMEFEPAEHRKSYRHVEVLSDYVTNTRSSSTYIVYGPYTIGTTPLVFHEITPTRDKFELQPQEEKLSVLPKGLNEGQIYYLIKGGNYIQLAETYENALAGIPVTFEDEGRGIMVLYQGNFLEPLQLKNPANENELLPFDFNKEYFLINKGRTFALASSYQNAINQIPMKLKQAHNTCYGLAFFPENITPNMAMWNKEHTSYVWSPDGTEVNCCSDNRTSEYVRHNGVTWGIKAIDVPYSLSVNIQIPTPSLTSDRPLASAGHTFYYGLYAWYYYGSIPPPEPQTFTINGITAVSTVVQASDPSGTLGQGYSYVYSPSDLAQIRSSLSAGLIEKLNSVPTNLDFYGKFDYAGGGLVDIFKSTYATGDMRWKYYSTTPETTPPPYGQYLAYIGQKQAHKKYTGSGTDSIYRRDTLTRTVCGNVTRQRCYQLWTPNNQSSYTYCEPGVFDTTYECWEETYPSDPILTVYNSTFDIFITGHLTVVVFVNVETGKQYAYVNYLDYGSGGNFGFTDPTTGFTNWVSGNYYSIGCNFTPTGLHCDASYMGENFEFTKNPDTNSTMVVSGINYNDLSYYGSYNVSTELRNNFYSRNAYDFFPESFSVNVEKYFFRYPSITLHFTDTVYHNWRKAGVTNNNSAFNLNGNTSIYANQIAAGVDFDSSESNISGSITCVFNEEKEKYESGPLSSNGINFKIEVFADGDLTGIRVFGSPNNFVKFTYKQEHLLQYYDTQDATAINFYTLSAKPVLTSPNTFFYNKLNTYIYYETIFWNEYYVDFTNNTIKVNATCPWQTGQLIAFYDANGNKKTINYSNALYVIRLNATTIMFTYTSTPTDTLNASSYGADLMPTSSSGVIYMQKSTNYYDLGCELPIFDPMIKTNDVAPWIALKNGSTMEMPYGGKIVTPQGYKVFGSLYENVTLSYPSHHGYPIKCNDFDILIPSPNSSNSLAYLQSIEINE